MTKVEIKRNYGKMEFKLKKRFIDITVVKNIHVPLGKTTVSDCKMNKKLSDLTDHPVIGKIKYKSNECLPQNLRVEMVSGKIHMNVSNTGDDNLHMS